jgi:Tol biopolymer transport system component
MADGRAGHTATLLPNGQVLVTGGEPSRGADARALDSAALYDPAGDRWRPAASLDTARTGHTATLLKTGEVLVAGGETGRGPGATILASAALYDPRADTWKPAPPMGAPRSRYTANLLPNGTVLALGGVTTGGGVLATAERYDPVANTWLPAGAVPEGRSGHCTTLLPDGKLLVTGGETGPDAAGRRDLLARSGLFDALTKAWSPVGDMARSRARHTATVLPGGRVLVSGGDAPAGAGQATSAEFFDTRTATWQPAAPLVADRAAHRAVPLGDGALLLVGGNAAAGGGPLATAELYDPAGGAWLTVAMAGPRARHTATTLADGRVLVVGGEGGDPGNLRSAELFSRGVPAPGTPAASAAPSSAPTPSGTPTVRREVILFSAHRGEVHDSQIYVMNADGGGQRQLTATKGHAWGPRIAPDGRTFLFSAVVAGQPHSDHGASGGGLVGSGNHDIYRANTDGANITKLTDDVFWDNGWSWSPDGKWITFTSDRDGNWEIYRMAPDGSQVTRLTSHPAQDGWPSWTPDGKAIVFASDREGRPQIYRMDADGGNPRRLLASASDDTFPFVSPDGRRIVYVAYRPGGNESEIYAMNADGSGATRLTSTVALNVTPAWSPDGGKIVFSSDRTGNFNIYVMNADGSGVRQLTSEGDNETPSWGVIEVATGTESPPGGGALAPRPAPAPGPWSAARQRPATRRSSSRRRA